MIVTESQMEEFEKASRPLIKWLNDNCHPHVTAIVSPDGAELVEGLCSVKVLDYIKD